MSENKPAVVFRRVRGRIVPIKISRDKLKDGAAGAALLGAGGAISAGAGAAYRAINRRSTKASYRAFRSLEKIQNLKFTGKNPTGVQMSLFRMAREKKAMQLIDKARLGSTRIGRFAAPIRIGGQAIGAGLVGIGVVKLTEALRGRKLSTEEAYSVGSSASLGAFLIGGYGGAGLRNAIKPTYKAAYPKIRLLKKALKL